MTADIFALVFLLSFQAIGSMLGGMWLAPRGMRVAWLPSLLFPAMLAAVILWYRLTVKDLNALAEQTFLALVAVLAATVAVGIGAAYLGCRVRR